MKTPIFQIPLHIMKQRIEIFENCNLQQACEWIAFKQKPMEFIRANAQGFRRGTLLPDKSAGILYEIMANTRLDITQYDRDYSEQIYAAAAKLKLAIYDGDIIAYGNALTPENTQQPQTVKITDISDTIKLDILQNTLTTNGTTYERVYIPFKDLKRMFHQASTVFDTIGTRYSTPYMDIMVEVIKEQKINKTNQPPVKILTDIIAKKMTEHNLKASTSLASRIATIIRLPESQKGHA